jgi:hypothetical protein
VPCINNFAAQKIFPHYEIQGVDEKKPMHKASVSFCWRAQEARAVLIAT